MKTKLALTVLFSLGLISATASASTHEPKGCSRAELASLKVEARAPRMISEPLVVRPSPKMRAILAAKRELMKHRLELALHQSNEREKAMTVRQTTEATWVVATLGPGSR